jgi:hypothetical protein
MFNVQRCEDVRLVVFAKYNKVDQAKEDTGRACSTHGYDNECIQGFGRKSRKKEITRKT